MNTFCYFKYFYRAGRCFQWNTHPHSSLHPQERWEMVFIDELYRHADIPLSSSFTPLGSIWSLPFQVLCVFPLLRYNIWHNQLKVFNSSWPAAFSLEVPAHGPLSIGLWQVRTSTAEGLSGKKVRSQCWVVSERDCRQIYPQRNIPGDRLLPTRPHPYISSHLYHLPKIPLSCGLGQRPHDQSHPQEFWTRRWGPNLQSISPQGTLRLYTSALRLWMELLHKPGHSGGQCSY